MIGETTASNPVLEVSVSFGRFENDSLSWEKWSAFSPNKYLEEVEKCATPGSVAQKKAYFEAHYKKIAARKAELLEQERQAQSVSNEKDLVCNVCSNREEVDVSEEQSPAEEVKQEEISLSDEIGGDCNSDREDPKEEEISVSEERPSTVADREEEIHSNVVGVNLRKFEEEVVVKEVEVISVEPISKEEETSESVESELERDSKMEEGKVKSDYQKELQKVTSVKEERIVGKSKKKLVSPNQITRMPKSSTPRVSNSKSISGSSRVSVSAVSQSSVKKAAITPSLSRNKNPSAGESKKVAPKSLHMSLTSGPTNSSSPSLSTNKKSLIMEKMGDKDIVKRAFKAFQNNFSQVRSYGDGSPLQKQMQDSSKRTEQKVSTSTTMPIKENGGSLKTNRPDKRSINTSSSIVLKSAESEEKRNELTKKPEQKSNATKTQKTRLQTRSKEAKEAEMKKLRESHNFKATPAFCRGQKMSKGTLDKVPAKTETHR